MANYKIELSDDDEKICSHIISIMDKENIKTADDLINNWVRSFVDNETEKLYQQKKNEEITEVTAEKTIKEKIDELDAGGYLLKDEEIK